MPIDVPAGERYPAEIDWLRRVHADGALIASVCSGSLILAHSGLLDRLEATGHWACRQLARQHYPRVRWREESVLARAGDGQRIVTAGGVTGDRHRWSRSNHHRCDGGSRFIDELAALCTDREVKELESDEP